MSNKYEEHHFCIISNNDKAIIFNKYGGIKDIIIVTLSLESKLLFFKKEMDFTCLFGVGSSYENTICEMISCNELSYELPTKGHFCNKRINSKSSV